MSLTVTFANADVAQKRTLSDLQLLLTFCHLTANNTRETSQAALARLIDYLDRYSGGARKPPFEIIKKIIAEKKLDEFVRSLKVSRHASRKKFFESAVGSDLDLRIATRDQIADKIIGIGYEKASLFALYRDRNWKEGAVIDLHVQEWLRAEFTALNSSCAMLVPARPVRTPKDYVKVEKLFLELASAKKVDPRALNIEIEKKFTDPTPFDKADEVRIRTNGDAAASYWSSRPSDRNISLSVA